MFPFRYFLQHTARVPKGFLRHQVLKLLNEKPMSGSEMMAEIEEETDGQWKPSPGSIYPLLSWLQDRGYIKEADGEVGIRRYTLTEQGKALLEQHVKTREELRERFRHFAPMPGFMGLLRGMTHVGMALWDLHDTLRHKPSGEALEETKKVLEETAAKIEAITQKLEKQSTE